MQPTSDFDIVKLDDTTTWKFHLIITQYLAIVNLFIIVVIIGDDISLTTTMPAAAVTLNIAIIKSSLIIIVGNDK